MSGCGGNCACAKEKTVAGTCHADAKTVVLFKNGMCPCGKSKDDCCHKDADDDAAKNAALGELCELHGGKNICEH